MRLYTKYKVYSCQLQSYKNLKIGVSVENLSVQVPEMSNVYYYKTRSIGVKCRRPTLSRLQSYSVMAMFMFICSPLSCNESIYVVVEYSCFVFFSFISWQTVIECGALCFIKTSFATTSNISRKKVFPETTYPSAQQALLKRIIY